MASLAAHRDARARGRRDGAPQRARGRREVAHRRDPRHRSLARAVWLPGVRRVVVIQSETKQLQGIVTLQDVARFLTL